MEKYTKCGEIHKMWTNTQIVEKYTNSQEIQKEEKYTKRGEILKVEKYTDSDWREVDASPDLPTTFSKPFLFATFPIRTKSKMDVFTK